MKNRFALPDIGQVKDPGDGATPPARSAQADWMEKADAVSQVSIHRFVIPTPVKTGGEILQCFWFIKISPSVEMTNYP